MANKTPRQIKKQLEQFYKFRVEAIRRNPDFIRDCEELVKIYNQYSLGPGPKTDEEIRRISENFFKKELDIWTKYQISVTLKDYNKPYFSGQYCLEASYAPDKKYFDFLEEIDRKTPPSERLGAYEKREAEIIEHKLRDGRFLKIQVDMYRDTELILHRVRELINNMKKDMKKYGLLKEFDKSPHLDKFLRYFAVWDLVQKRQQVWPFERIAEKLKEEGWYKKQTLKQATVLARQDYRTACKLIGIPLKVNKGALRKTSKPIIKLKEGKRCAEEFVKWEKRLVADGLGVDGIIKEGSCEVKDKLVSSRVDGPVKQILKKELQTNQEVSRRTDAKRKAMIRALFK